MAWVNDAYIQGYDPATLWTGPVMYMRHQQSRSALVKTAEHALRRKRPHIWIPPTVFIASREQQQFYIVNRPDGFVGVMDDSGSPQYVFDWNEIYPLLSIAMRKALSNLKNQNVNYSQTIAESNQVARLIAGSAKKIAGSFRALRKGDARGALQALGLKMTPKQSRAAPLKRLREARNLSRRELRAAGKSPDLFVKVGGRVRRVKDGNVDLLKTNAKAVADAHLEIQYGWKPLLRDVYGAAKDRFDEEKADPNLYRITVRATKSEVRDISGEYNLSAVAKTQRNGTLTYSARCRYYYTLVNPQLATMSQIGVTNPANLAWELLPWSFVADWFAPIGGWINSWDAQLGWSFLGGCYTAWWEVDYSGVCRPRSPSDPQFSTSVGRFRKKYVYRSTGGPTAFTNFPGFKNPFSRTHVANAIALLVSSVSVR